jgi:hypothetical protein
VTSTLKTSLLAALGLLAITLAAFAVAWPFNTATYDDWVFYYTGLPGVLNATFFYAVRPYALNGVQLSHLLFPGQAQGIYVLHVAGFAVAAFCIFHIVRLLKPGYTWFAFLAGAVYLFYIPTNSVQLIPLQFEVYSWTAAVMMVAFALYVQGVYLKGWMSVAVIAAACVMGYVAVLSYESTYPLLFVAPFVVWLAIRKFSWRFALASAAWWVATGISFLQFLLPYLRGDASTQYQATFFKPAQGIGELLANTATFYGQSFPLETIYKGLAALPTSPYLSTALILAVVAVVAVAMVWRRFPGERELPSVRALVVLLVVGLALNGISGAANIYATLLTPRSLFFSAPAQAVVVVSVFGLAAWGLRRLAVAPLGVSLFAFTIVFFTLGAHWYHEHQIAAQGESADFSQHRQLFQEILARVPNVAEGTLLVYDCPREADPVYTLRAADPYGIRYLYRDRGTIRATLGVYFQADRVVDADSYSTLLGPPLPTEYGYDEVIGLRCTEDGIDILDELPEEWGGEAAAYDPYARIVNGFIQPEQARILAR